MLFPGDMETPDEPELLEGGHVQRREVKCHDMDDVNAKRSALEGHVRYWVRSIDAE